MKFYGDLDMMGNEIENVIIERMTNEEMFGVQTKEIQPNIEETNEDNGSD